MFDNLIDDYKNSRDALTEAIRSFEIDAFQELDEDKKVTVLHQLAELFSVEQFRFNAFELIVVLSDTLAKELLLERYLSVDIPSNRRSSYRLFDLEVLFTDFVKHVGTDEAKSFLRNAQIGNSKLQHEDVKRIIEDELSEAFFQQLLEERNRSKGMFNWETLAYRLNNLLNKDMTRKEFSNYANELRADVDNGLFTFKSEKFQEKFAELSVVFSSVIYQTEDGQYLYQDEYLEEVLNELYAIVDMQ